MTVKRSRSRFVDRVYRGLVIEGGPRRHFYVHAMRVHSRIRPPRLQALVVRVGHLRVEVGRG